MNKTFLPGPVEKSGSLLEDRVLKWWIVCLVVFKFWLVQAQDLIAAFSPHDDYLFVKLAKHILNGQWLGPYDNLTLVKGPVYPLFIAFSHHTGLPLLFVQHLIYALFCILVLVALRPLITRRWLLMSIFFLLLFNPFTYAYPGTGRAFRFGLSMPLVLALFSAMCGLLMRTSKGFCKQLIWAATIGLLFSLLWYTREEGIWMLPSILLFGIYYLLIQEGLRRGTIFKRCCCLLLVPLIFLGFKTTFSHLNQKYYGAPHIVELKAPEFQAALGGLMNINGHEVQPQIPVSDKSQEDAFRVSPSFKKLEPLFQEAAKGHQWLKSYFIWTFRDIVSTGGYADSYPEALDFYAKIGEEIQAACTAGEIECLDRKPTIRPIWKSEYNKLIPKHFWQIFKQAITFSSFTSEEYEYTRWLTSATAEMVYDYRFVTREHLVPGYRTHMENYPSYYMDMITEKFRLLTDIAKGYKSIIEYLFWAALGAHLFFAVRMILERQITFEFVSGCMVLGGILSLVSVLTYVEITLWAIDRPLFSAYPLVLLYISMMFAYFYNYTRTSLIPSRT